MSNKERDVRIALSRALCSVTNYPAGIDFRLLGMDLSKLVDAATQAVMDSGAVEVVDDLMGRPDVNRVEVVDGLGRAYVNMDACEVVTSLQDGGKTLKIFLRTQR